jgi:hypothetical protein
MTYTGPAARTVYLASAPKNAVGRKPPMLVVVGHGSIDDPDASAIYEQLHGVSSRAILYRCRD